MARLSAWLRRRPANQVCGAERLQRAAHGLDLAQFEVLVEAVTPLLPELAVLRFELGHGLRAGERLMFSESCLRELLDELIGLGEQIAGVDEDDGDVRIGLRHQVQRHGRLRAEARRHRERSGKIGQRPAHARRGIDRSQPLVDALLRPRCPA